MTRALRLTEEQYGAMRKRRDAENKLFTEQMLAVKVARPKFGNVATDGHASKREAKRAEVLRMLAKCGDISELREQVKYVLIPKQEGERECTYTADFVYRNKFGDLIVEDTKGVRTQQYVIRRKLMLLVHGVRIKEV